MFEIKIRQEVGSVNKTQIAVHKAKIYGLVWELLFGAMPLNQTRLKLLKLLLKQPC